MKKTQQAGYLTAMCKSRCWGRIALIWFLLAPAAFMIPLRSANALDIVLVEAPAGATQTPIYDPNLNNLGDIMQAAANYWESIILDNHQVTVTYGYVDLAPAIHGLAQVTGNDGQRATTGNLAFDIETNSFGDWYFDQTPTNHSEFSMHQVLNRDLTPVAQNLYFDGSPNDVHEVGYWGNYVGDDLGRDALTVAVHELGHILGLSESLPGYNAEIADGDYDFNVFYTQANSYAVKYHSSDDGERDHVRASDATMAVGAGQGDRNLPGATDVFALASVSGWFLVDLPRKDFWGNGATNWHNSLNWPGNRLPDSGDEVHVRNSASVSLMGAAGAAGNLFIQENSSVNTGTNHLEVADKITIEGVDPGSSANLVVNAGGRVTADEIELNDGGLLTVTNGGSTEVDVDVLDINEGGVLLGNGAVRFGTLLRNDGTITAIAGAGNELALLTGSVDLDGGDGDGEVFATLGNIRVSANMTDGFDGRMTIGEGRQVQIFAGWELGESSVDGGLIRLNGGDSSPATLRSTNGSANFVKGRFEVSGMAEIAGSPTVFESEVTTDIEADGELTISANSTMRGATFEGGGTLIFDSQLNVEQSTTMNPRVVDLDGSMGDTVVNIDSSVLTINADRVEESANNRFDGTLAITGQQASLDINLNDAQAVWQMDGELTANNGGSLISWQNTLAGSPVHVSGTMNMSTLLDISASMDLSGTMNLSGVAATVRLSGGPHVIRNGASVSGSGQLRVNTSGSLFLEDGANVDINVNNLGQLQPGTSLAGARIGSVSFGDGYSQSSTATLGIELADNAATGDYDILFVEENASLAGELTITAIDGFVPDVGQVYSVVQADSVSGTFDEVTFLSDSIMKFDAVVTYPGTRVAVRITDVFMFGDFNDDMTLDCADVDTLVAEIASGGMGAGFDLNGDSVVDESDLSLWLEEAGTHIVGGGFLPGDANLDGFVDTSDFNIWNGEKFTSGSGWCGGDFNADGVTDTSDFNVWNGHKFQASVPVAVPEPAGVCLFWAIIMFFVPLIRSRP